MRREKLLFLTTGGRFETDLIVWVWRLLFIYFFKFIFYFPNQEKKNTNPKNNIFQEPNRSVNVMFAVFDSADASGRIFCLWCCSFDERLLKGLHCFFFSFLFFSPFLSCRNATFLFILILVSVKQTLASLRQTHFGLFCSSLSASLIYCSCQ